MDEDNELWELVRKRVYNEEPEENLENIEETIENNDVDEQEEISQTVHEELAESFIPDLTLISLFKEGIFAGISSGGSVAAALQISNEVENAVIVSIICDRGDRYLSTNVFPE